MLSIGFGEVRESEDVIARDPGALTDAVSFQFVCRDDRPTFGTGEGNYSHSYSTTVEFSPMTRRFPFGK